MRRPCQECGRAATYRRAGQRTSGRGDHDLCPRCWHKSCELLDHEKREADRVRAEINQAWAERDAELAIAARVARAR